MKKVVIASDSYKGCLSSEEVALTMRDALVEMSPACEVLCVPVADGGEGTVDAMVDSLGGRKVSAIVSDPLGRPVKAEYGIAGDLAIIESAAACGLTLLSPAERNPLLTSTYGLGELILDALGRGCRRFVIGLGGSATNDGGMGMVSVPHFLEKVSVAEFTVACDVDTPFIGPKGASRVFAPQKGASPADVEVLEVRMTEMAERILKETGVDVRDMQGAGAAGGLGGAFCAYCGAMLRRGVDMVLDAICFDALISGADFIITGEGCSDFQTPKGKTAFGVLERARRQNIPVALISGGIRDEEILKAAGFSLIAAATPAGQPLEEAMKPETAKSNIQSAIRSLIVL